MLVSLDSMLRVARANGFGVVAANAVNLATAIQLISEAEEAQAPIIIAYHNVFDSLLETNSFVRFAKILRAEAEQSEFPVVIHLDHCCSLEAIKAALDAGFNSVMYDGSSLPLEENIDITRQVVEIAQQYHACVEGELGYVGGDSLETVASNKSVLTDPSLAPVFVEQTGVTALAIAIGTVHGQYAGTPILDFERLAQIRALTDIPLVLHGGSGTGEENIQRLIAGGMCKINVFSDLLQGLDLIVKESNQLGYLKLNDSVKYALRNMIMHYFSITMSNGRGRAYGD